MTILYLEPIPNDCLLGQTKYTTADFDTSRDKCILALFLCFGTVWLGLQIFNFRHSPFLSPFVRELISDYALAFSVIIFSVIGSVGFKVFKKSLTPWFSEHARYAFFTFFQAIKLATFNYVDLNDLKIEITSKLLELPAEGWSWAVILGFCLSLLFFMDQDYGLIFEFRFCVIIKKNIFSYLSTKKPYKEYFRSSC